MIEVYVSSHDVEGNELYSVAYFDSIIATDLMNFEVERLVERLQKRHNGTLIVVKGGN